MKFLRTGEISLTRGPIVKSVVLFSFPLLISGILQQLYSIVDLFFVGYFLDSYAVASLGIASLLVSCIIGLFSGLSIGANIIVAMAYGEGKRERVRQLARLSVMIGLVGGLLFAAIGLSLSSWYVQAMGTPSASIAGAELYLRIYFLAMVSVALYNMGAALCQAIGNSLMPMIAQLIGCLLNIICNWFFIHVMGLGIGGVAASTFFANTAACVIVFTFLFRKSILRTNEPWHREDIRLGLKRILETGIPIGLQSLVITLSNVVIQRQINILGVDAIAAFSIYFKVELPIYLAIVAIGQATTTFVAQNHGSGQDGRMWRGALTCQAISLILTAILSAIELAFGRELFGLFSHDSAVIDCGMTIIGITFPFYVLYSILEVQGGIARGLGHTIVPAIVVFAIICVLRMIIVLSVTASSVAIEPIAIAYPVTWALAALCQMGYVLYLRFKG